MAEEGGGHGEEEGGSQEGGGEERDKQWTEGGKDGVGWDQGEGRRKGQVEGPQSEREKASHGFPPDNRTQDPSKVKHCIFFSLFFSFPFFSFLSFLPSSLPSFLSFSLSFFPSFSF